MANCVTRASDPLATAKLRTTHTGAELHAGLEVTLEPGKEKRLLIRQ